MGPLRSIAVRMPTLQGVEEGVEGLGVEGEGDGGAAEGGLEEGVAEFEGVEAFGAGGDEGVVGEIFCDDGEEVFEEEGVFVGRGLGDGDVDGPEFGSGEGFGGGFGEFGDGGAGAVESEGVVFGGEFSAGAGDFEAVGAGEFAGGGDEVADGGGRVGRGLRVFEDGGDFVFDFDGVVFAGKADGGDAGGREVGDPVEEVEVVGALVDEDAAAFAFPGGAPFTGGVVGVGAEPVGDGPGDAGDGAELAVAEEVADFLIERVGALVEHEGELEVGMFGAPGVDEMLGGGEVGGEGFFGEDVEVVFEGGERVGDVGGMGAAEDDGVAEIGGEEFLGAREDGDGGEFGAEGVEAGGVDVGDGGEAGIGEGGEVVGVEGADVAEADDTDTEGMIDCGLFISHVGLRGRGNSR